MPYQLANGTSSDQINLMVFALAVVLMASFVFAIWFTKRRKRRLTKQGMTEIEKFILGSDKAHNIEALQIDGDTWCLVVFPGDEFDNLKTFFFTDVSDVSEELLLEPGEELEFSLPLIGFECSPTTDGKWSFVLNASDVEWSFTSNWPVRNH